MAKDYAKNIFTNKKKSTRKKQGPDNALLVVLLLVITIGAGGYWMHAHNQKALFYQEKFIAWMQNIKSVFKQQSAAVLAKNEKLETATHVSQDQDIKYDFYTELPNMKVGELVNDDEATQQDAKASAASEQQQPKKVSAKEMDSSLKSAAAADKTKALAVKKYYLQLGAFKKEADASRFRLSLLLAGTDAEIVKVMEIYQVQQGPFTNNAQAKAAQHRLENKGFSSEIKKT